MLYTIHACALVMVALRKESVDRNVEDYLDAGTLDVALRKESVDRNDYNKPRYPWTALSLSARRAWIEMFSAKYAL